MKTNHPYIEGEIRLLRGYNRRARIILLALILLLYSCSWDPGLQQGYVYDRRIHPAWVQMIPGYSHISCSRDETEEECHTTYYPPEYIDHPAEFELDISNCKHYVRQSECKTNWTYVSEDVYNAHPLSSYYGGQ